MNFTNTPRCVVFGEALVDTFHDRIVPGGAPFNVAAHLAGLGLKPHLVSRIGHDDAGQLLRVLAHRMDLDLAGVQVDPQHQTGRVDVLEGPTGHVFQIAQDQAYDHIDANDALDTTLDYAGSHPTWLYFGTLALRSAHSRASLDAMRSNLVHRAFVDLNWRDAGTTPEQALDALHQVSVLKLSEEELERVLNWLGQPGKHARAIPAAGDYRGEILALMYDIDLEWLLVTHGDQGASAWSADGVCAAYVPAEPVPHMQDTVGAGDAFSAMALAGLMTERPIGQLLRQSVAFASAICGVRGALPRQADFYRHWQHDDVRKHQDAHAQA